jgi:hypothetical protein
MMFRLDPVAPVPVRFMRLPHFPGTDFKIRHPCDKVTTRLQYGTVLLCVYCGHTVGRLIAHVSGPPMMSARSTASYRSKV